MAKKPSNPSLHIKVKKVCWYENLTARQLVAALTLPPQQFPHGTPGQPKGKTSR